MDAYGLGDNVHVIRFLTKVGKAVSEDGMPASRSTGGASEKTQAQRLYNNTHKSD